MELSFEGYGLAYTGHASPAEKGPKDKHRPWTVQLRASGAHSSAGAIEGRLQVTEVAADAARERAPDGEAEGLLRGAFERAFIAELGLRPLQSGFDFIVDHRFVTQYQGPEPKYTPPKRPVRRKVVRRKVVRRKVAPRAKARPVREKPPA